MHPIDCRSEVTGLYTGDYKSQQQTHVNKKRAIAMKENSAKSKHTGNGIEKGPPRDVGGSNELAGGLGNPLPLGGRRVITPIRASSG